MRQFVRIGSAGSSPGKATVVAALVGWAGLAGAGSSSCARMAAPAPDAGVTPSVATSAQPPAWMPAPSPLPLPACTPDAPPPCTGARELSSLVDAVWSHVNPPPTLLLWMNGDAHQRCLVETIARCALALPTEATAPDAGVTAGLLMRAGRLTRIVAGDAESTLVLLQRTVALDPTDRDARRHISRLLFDLDRHEEAIAHLDRLRILAHESGDLHNEAFATEMMGRAYLVGGRTAEAERILQESLEKFEASTNDASRYWGCPYQALGELYSRTGNSAKSAEFFALAADREPGIAESQYDAAIALFASGEDGRAADYAARGKAVQVQRVTAPLLETIEQTARLVAAGTPPTPLQRALKAAALSDSFRGNQPDAALRYAERALALEDSPAHRALVARYGAKFSASGTLEDAIEAFSNGDLWRSEGILRTLLESRSTVEAVVVLGLVRVYKRDYDEANGIFARAEQLLKDNPGAAIGRGHERLARRDFAGAARLFAAGSAALCQPRAAQPTQYNRLMCRMADLGLAWNASNQNRHVEAIRAFDRVLADRPNDVLALVGKGNALSGLHRIDEAAVLFKKALEAQPNSPYALAELGFVSYNKGDFAAAESLFKRALQEDDQNYTCPFEGLGLVYLQQGKLAEAKENLQRAIQINPDIEFKKFNALAKIRLTEGRIDEARALLQRSIENYPYDPEAKAMLAKLPSTGVGGKVARPPVAP